MEDSDFNELRLQNKAKSAGLTLLSQEETSKEVEKKLLSGWKMTNESCPISEFPLLRKDGVSWSPRLQMSVKLEGNDKVMKASAAAKTAYDDDGTTSARIDSKQSLKGGKTDISGKLGEKLLMGWKMLGEECPITHLCPLMEEPKTGRKWSAALDKFIDDALVVIEAEETMDEEKELFYSLDSNQSSNQSKKEEEQQNGAGNGENDDDVISARIGQRLLQGWIMLPDACPITHSCPLLKHPTNGGLYSAALDRMLDQDGKALGNGEKRIVSKASEEKKNKKERDGSSVTSNLMRKIEAWSEELVELNDLDSEFRILQAIKQTVDLLKALEELQGVDGGNV